MYIIPTVYYTDAEECVYYTRIGILYIRSCIIRIFCGKNKVVYYTDFRREKILQKNKKQLDMQIYMRYYYLKIKQQTTNATHKQEVKYDIE